ncbi:phosphate uptake regulator PhoU [Candidatus Woesearchaeota archaeon]|nr:phosphate uptake regulator PhoU [Candidatus Woesearchaeota archaeon]
MQYRKLIQHGPSSLTVALPYKWVNKNGLQKGDSVALEEDEQGLRIAMKPMERSRAIALDLSGNDFPSTVTILTTVYRRGYDEVAISYRTPEEYQHVSSAVRMLLGFGVLENRKSRCVIKSLPTQIEQDFPTLFRRVFLILLQMLEDLGDVVGDPQSLRTFYHRDADLNSIVNLAIRMVNKGFVQDRYEELHIFHTLLLLEECGDDVTRFTIELQQSKHGAKMKDAVQKCAGMVRLLYDTYFQKKGGVMDFYKQYYLYWPDAKKAPTPVYDFYAKAKDKPVFYLRSIVEKVVHLAEILLLPQTMDQH